MSKQPKVPQTVSDRTWGKVQRAAARQVDVIEGPWTDPKKAAKKATWNSARKNARKN